jgi:hypothetical protein
MVASRCAMPVVCTSSRSYSASNRSSIPSPSNGYQSLLCSTKAKQTVREREREREHMPETQVCVCQVVFPPLVMYIISTHTCTLTITHHRFVLNATLHCCSSVYYLIVASYKPSNSITYFTLTTISTTLLLRAGPLASSPLIRTLLCQSSLSGWLIGRINSNLLFLVQSKRTKDPVLPLLP